MDHYQRSARNWFAGHPIDRIPDRRQDSRWVAERLQDPNTRLIPVWNGKNLFAKGPVPQPVLLAPQDLGGLIAQAESTVLLGEAEGRVYFAVGLHTGDGSPPPEMAALGEFRNLRWIGAGSERETVALLAYAKAITYWHHRERFCADCGSPTESAEGGHLRVCTNPQCGQYHFPRTNPAIIVLVTSGVRCLLGRQATWPKGLYATIAGFVEPGESLEEAVVREVMEETGVRVREVTYHSSQPWPFPSSIMLGFTAQAASEEITLGDGELEDARWFSREEIRSGVKDEWLQMPLRASISFRLIEDWFDGEGSPRLEDLCIIRPPGPTQVGGGRPRGGPARAGPPGGRG